MIFFNFELNHIACLLIDVSSIGTLHFSVIRKQCCIYIYLYIVYYLEIVFVPMTMDNGQCPYLSNVYCLKIWFLLYLLFRVLQLLYSIISLQVYFINIYYTANLTFILCVFVIKTVYFTIQILSGEHKNALWLLYDYIFFSTVNFSGQKRFSIFTFTTIFRYNINFVYLSSHYLFKTEKN